jgi:hypothetical protein
MLKDPRLEITYVGFNGITFLIMLQFLTLLMGLGWIEVGNISMPEKSFSIMARLANLASLDNVDSPILERYNCLYVGNKGTFHLRILQLYTMSLGL